MRSKLRAAVALAVGASTGCGILGTKGDVSSLFQYNPGNLGCLNTAGANAQAFLAGTIARSDWDATFSCATSSLNMFTRFVISSDPSGYTKADIQSFVGKFLLTNAPVTDALVEAGFQLKAAVLGGTDQIFTNDEINKFVTLINLLQTESDALLPMMGVAHNDYSGLFSLADAEAASLARIGAAIPGGSQTFTWTALQTLLNEVGKIVGQPAPQIASYVPVAKAIALGGDPTGIGGTEWVSTLTTIGSYLAAGLPIYGVDMNSFGSLGIAGSFLNQVLARGATAFGQTMALNGGALPLSRLNSLLEALPSAWFTVDLKGVIEPTIATVFTKLFPSAIPLSIDPQSLSTLTTLMSTWSNEQVALEAIFNSQNLDPDGVVPEAFVDASVSWAQGRDAATTAAASKLAYLAAHYVPLFKGDDQEITYTAWETHSLNDMTKILWMRSAAELLLTAYAGGPTSLANVIQLETFVNDFMGIALAFKLVQPADPTNPNALPDKRFFEADTFTFSANGDFHLDIDEGVYLVAGLYSAALLSNRIRAGTEPTCALATQPSQEPLGWQWQDINCFRQIFFGQYELFWQHFPHLVAYMATLTAAQRDQMRVNIENAGRLHGTTDSTIASFDIQSMAGAMQYVETLIMRFDADQDQTLDVAESLAAFPVFDNFLAKNIKCIYPNNSLINTSNQSMMEAIFTDIISTGTLPSTSVGGMIDFLVWWAGEGLGTWKYNADRMKLYGVFGAIGVASQNATPGCGG
jgi:hypothetical protein